MHEASYLRLHLKALPSAIIEEDKIKKNQTDFIGNDFGNDNHEIGNDGDDFGNDNHKIGNDGDDFGNEDIEERVISILRATPNISLEQIAKETNLSKRPISRLTKKLIDENKIKTCWQYSYRTLESKLKEAIVNGKFRDYRSIKDCL